MENKERVIDFLENKEFGSKQNKEGYIDIITKGVLYQDKSISYLSGLLNLTKTRVRQLLWVGMRDLKNKNVKPGHLIKK